MENGDNPLNKDETNINEIKEEQNIENVPNSQNINNEDINKNEIIINNNNNNENDNNINIQNEISNEEQKDKAKEEGKNQANPANKVITNPIYVFSAKVLEINAVKLLIYFIKGTAVPKKIARSFKDIEVYRNYLRYSWPGTYIPNFAFREETIEENHKIVPEDKKLNIMNHFFKQISEIKHLLHCETTKIFITKPGDFQTEINSIKKETMKDISEKYLKTFTDFSYNRKEIEDKEIFIRDFVKILEETFKQFIIIGATVLKELFNFKREQNTIKYITDMFVDLEESMPNKKKRLAKVKDLAMPICSVSNKY